MAQNVKISELQQNTNPTGKEEFPYAKSGSNGKMTLDTIKQFVGNGGGGGGSGTRTDEIFAPGTLPDSRQSNTWIFTSDGLHGVEFVGSQAKVYEMATAFDVDGEKTLLTTVTAPGDINMGLLNDDGTILILLGYKSSWRIMYGVNTEEGGEAFMFDPNSSEYTYTEYQNRGEQVPYYKSTTDLASGDYDQISIYSTAKGEDVPFSDLKFIGMCYRNQGLRYVYYPETDEYGQIYVGVYEWNNPGVGQAYRVLEGTRITVILDLSDGRNGPTYMYGDPLQAGTDGWYKVVNYNSDYRPNYPDSEDQFFADGNGSIGTVNDNIQFIGGNQRYTSSDRYLGYNSTKQIVTQYNVIGNGGDDDNDKINVPSFTRFENAIDNLDEAKQNVIPFSVENQSMKSTKSNLNPFSRTRVFSSLEGSYESASISFYQNGTIAFLVRSGNLAYCGSVNTPYEITEQEIIDIYNSGNTMIVDAQFGQAFMSEDGLHVIYKNGTEYYVCELGNAFDLTSSTGDPVRYSLGNDVIFNYDGTAFWRYDRDDADQNWYWNKYTGSGYQYDQFTLAEHQGSTVILGHDLADAFNGYLFSLDGQYIVAGNKQFGGIAKAKLSTPFDLSNIEYIETLEEGGLYKRNLIPGVPTSDFVYIFRNDNNYQGQNIRKYSYNPAIAYPSMEGVIYGVADAYKPVEGTIDNGTVTISGTQLYTKLTDVDSDIVIQCSNVIPGMRYIVHGNAINNIVLSEDSNSIYLYSSIEIPSGEEFILEVTAVEENHAVDLSGGPQVISVINP